jgi:hypothetical protein
LSTGQVVERVAALGQLGLLGTKTRDFLTKRENHSTTLAHQPIGGEFETGVFGIQGTTQDREKVFGDGHGGFTSQFSRVRRVVDIIIGS